MAFLRLVFEEVVGIVDELKVRGGFFFADCYLVFSIESFADYYLVKPLTTCAPSAALFSFLSSMNLSFFVSIFSSLPWTCAMFPG